MIGVYLSPGAARTFEGTGCGNTSPGPFSSEQEVVQISLRSSSINLFLKEVPGNHFSKAVAGNHFIKEVAGGHLIKDVAGGSYPSKPNSGSGFPALCYAPNISPIELFLEMSLILN